jgi:hypothetical protein
MQMPVKKQARPNNKTTRETRKEPAELWGGGELLRTLSRREVFFFCLKARRVVNAQEWEIDDPSLF